MKNDPVLKFIPVIFITSNDDTESIIEGFNQGGNDYISKPFNAQELIARVKTQIKLVRLLKEKIINTKFESIGRLSAGIVHEINTPLTFMKGSFEMMKMDIDDLDNSPLKENIISEYDSIQSGIEKISKIINSMHELAQSSSEAFEKTDIKHTLSTALVLLYNNYKNDIKIFIEDEPFDLHYTPKEPMGSKIQKQRIEQVWMILLKNSIDILNERKIEDKFIRIDFMEDEKYNTILIEDSGKGIEKSKIETLFDEPLNSSKSYSGMGVGLYIAKKIILEHQGSIEVSNTNSGALFKISIPKP